MTPDDRELLQSLRRQQTDLQRSLARLDADLATLEARAQEVPPAVAIPPPPPPRVTVHSAAPPPPPPVAGLALHELPPLPPPPKPSWEFQFGRWLTRIGAVFGVITLVLIFSLTHALIFRHLGPGGILGISGLLCVGIVIWAQRLERRGNDQLILARSLLALGLGGLYVTLYAAHSFESVRVIANPLVAGALLLLWSVYVLWMADRRKAQTLALFAIALAYFSTAINPVGRFSMAADLLLAGTAVFFLLRHGWAALSYLGLLGTYFALLRRLVIDQNGELVLDTGRALPFTPYAVYLIGAWVVFTAAVLMSTSPGFRGAKRLVFLTLNNGALAGLLTLTTYLAGYGYLDMGWTLFWTGVVFLATALLSYGRRPDPAFHLVPAAYLGQGLAALTAGVMGVYTGITRGVLVAVEAFFLGMASSMSGSAVVRVVAMITAGLATLLLIWEIAVNAHHPWLLGFGGAFVMLSNAHWARQDVRHTPRAHQRVVLSASYYSALALGLIATAMATELSAAMLPPALALAAVVLTFSIYLFPIFELPPLAQTLLLAAQGLVLFPTDTGEALPRWSTACVAAITLGMLTWWSRQRITRASDWLVAVTFLYALALVGLAYHAVRPYVDGQDWMISASLLSVAFLIFGAFTRLWSLAIMGQVFLLAALGKFFLPDGSFLLFPWSWWAAAVAVTVVFATGHAIHAWLRSFPEIRDPARGQLRVLAFSYQFLALVMVIRWIFAAMPASEQIATFLLLGSFLVAWNAARVSAFGVRCGFILSAFGVLLILQSVQAQTHAYLTLLNGVALFLLLCQPALLRHRAPRLISEVESWGLVLISSAIGWIFVAEWVAVRVHPNYLTMGWALYALCLFILGLLTWERRQRWCGLGILLAAMVRVLFYDIWGFSNGYKVLTFIVLTLIAFGVGYICTRPYDRLRAWL